MRFLIAAGGTGGHLFPALAVVNSIRESYPDSQFHFYGRSDKIEGRIVPSLGYKLHSSNIFGLSSIKNIKNIVLPFLIIADIIKLFLLIKRERLDAVICTGAYISFPAGYAARLANIPLFLLESNVNPGKTISMLASYSAKIFTSFDNTKKFFPVKLHSRIHNLGNPIRKEIIENSLFFEKNKNDLSIKNHCFTAFGLNSNIPVVLIFGGSLGAKSINNAVLNSLDYFSKKGYQIL